ncbi:NTP transferase domain-containing protein [Streptomyces formicae]|uniref:Mannose-1-phosphate guanylyltransferase / Phosphomannomutase n=1 Tax=Streptomyces formicae TaxID=1616117 RepID=A0A291Q0K7_9ACTN|nr:NTP transferase domain-containing protein [Streptomyces formicae]ATL25036.1 Mannose-1-phosphate guanylyltransferase / Phosphomannomutase [Streptomyces formicae]ATL33163.1 Nucleotidyl transferase [Streptomyces formicae]
MSGAPGRHLDRRLGEQPRPTPSGLQVVVLAGGLGSRLGELGTHLPKILLPVAGRPFLDLLLAPLLDAGLSRFHFCLGHLADPVLEHLHRLPEPIEATSHIDTVPRGTGGALRAAAPYLNETFLLVLGDTLLDIPYADAARWPGRRDEAAMVVTSADTGVHPNTRVQDGRVSAYDKNAHAQNATDPDGSTLTTDTGVCVLRRDALRHLAQHEDPVDLGVLFRALIRRRALAAHLVDRPFTDIGTPERYTRFRDGREHHEHREHHERREQPPAP